MILYRLKLENFKKYTYKKIDFTQGLIGIIGKNGSGKSTIFEAILFALYGEFKTKGYKEIIRNSYATTKDAVVVELDFEFEGIEYRVNREFRGKALSASAKLYKNEELITSGAKEVSASIINLVKMNKEAFIHTLFASQKELTSLSSLKNEDRKKMIRKLLGLEKIDFIEKQLVEKSRELKREIEAFKEVLLSEEEVVNKKDSIKNYEENIKALEKQVEEQSKELDKLKLDEIEIKKALGEYTKTKELKQELLSKAQILKTTLNSHIQRNEQLKKELEILNEKQKELKGLENIKLEYTKLHDSISEQEKLRGFSIRKEGLLKEQISLREQYKKSSDSIKILEHETLNHKKYVQKQELLEKSLNEKQTFIQDLLKQEKEIVSYISGEKKLIEDLNSKVDKIQSLGRDSDCPTCTRPLLDEYDVVLSTLQNTINLNQKQRIENKENEYKSLELKKQEEESSLKTISKEHLELSQAINLMESKKRDLIKEKEHFEKVKEHGLKNKEELEELQHYTYDKTIHEDLLIKQKELKTKYEYVLNLEAMLKRIDEVNENLQKEQNYIKEYTLKFEQKEKEYLAINYEESKHKQKQEEFETSQKQKEQKSNEINEHKVQIASITGQIKTLQESLDNNSIQEAKVKTKKDDLLDYEKIKISLGVFKTKLNEKVAPRISNFASKMYSQITKGKYQHIEVSNDFDFYIYDEGNKYPIERFSGGEVDLANLVLRIAISKTLSELSGASSIGFLAFDEVFGSQDESRRMEIIEAFHTIKEQYRQIFLISHEMEIKEMFEAVVEL